MSYDFLQEKKMIFRWMVGCWACWFWTKEVAGPNPRNSWAKKTVSSGESTANKTEGNQYGLKKLGLQNVSVLIGQKLGLENVSVLIGRNRHFFLLCS